ncbi:secretoglobin family 1D member 4-like [Rhinolophus sinicus]|uniref:secretoglobin family 1D member 4-like n=1 Tax=Rhinolophus sinicus TaxID=89399 RepID=UPI003D78B42D
MRLFFPVLLVTLAFCCYEVAPANVNACPSLVLEVASFIVDTTSRFRDKLQTYNPPPEALEAKVQVKECVNRMSFEKRLQILTVLFAVNSGFSLQGAHVALHTHIALHGLHRVATASPLKSLKMHKQASSCRLDNATQAIRTYF